MLKINRMLMEWSPGDVHGSKWLKERGIGQRLAYKYYENGILQKIGPGVYLRGNDTPSWPGLVKFLQNEMNFPVHVSGKKALELHGHAHYLLMNQEQTTSLTTYEKKVIPTWLKKIEQEFRVSFFRSKLFDNENFLSNYSKDEMTIKISSRELAIIEFIDSINLKNSLETAENYMESLTNLREDVMQLVLEKCKSVKCKRVFLFLAEKLNLPFFKKVSLKKISLGAGKRSIVENGKFDKKYQITVDRSGEENPF